MNMRISNLLPFLLLFALGSAAPVEPLPEEQLSSRDQQKLGGLIADYFEAKDSRKGVLETFEAVQEWVAKLQKKRKGESPLMLVEDFQKAFYHARVGGVLREKIKKGMISEEKLDGGAKFNVYVPKGYNAKKDSTALVLSVPDKGVDTRKHMDESWKSASDQSGVVVAAVPMPNNTRFWGELSTSEESGVGAVMRTYAHMLRRYAVDMERVFLAGEGEGIGAALATAAAFPHLFAGVICRGAGVSFDPTNLGNVPTLFLAGGAHATDFEAKSKELGYENCTVNPAGGEADIWGWYADRRRAVMPQSISFSPTSPYSSTSYWVTMFGIDVEESPRIDAKVDRESNTITIDAAKTSSVKLYLNDLLVDLEDPERPLKVVVNGVLHEQVVPRNLRVMLDNAYNTGDSGRIFTNVVSFDVPESGDSEKSETEPAPLSDD
jgi:poly(3-hydroxybutyrate) depolymerase